MIRAELDAQALAIKLTGIFFLVVGWVCIRSRLFFGVLLDAAQSEASEPSIT